MTNYGWECPKCGSVYAPIQLRCTYCTPRYVGTANTGTACNCPTDSGGRKLHQPSCYLSVAVPSYPGGA